MRVSVLDTSALLRLYVPDGPIPEGLQGAVDEAWRLERAILSPELALAEAGQVLVKKLRSRVLDAREADAIIDAILALPVRWEGHGPLMPRAMALSHTLGTSVYDALFIALALGRGGELLTADGRMARAMTRARALEE